MTTSDLEGVFPSTSNQRTIPPIPCGSFWLLAESTPLGPGRGGDLLLLLLLVGLAGRWRAQAMEPEELVGVAALRQDAWEAATNAFSQRRWRAGVVDGYDILVIHELQPL